MSRKCEFCQIVKTHAFKLQIETSYIATVNNFLFILKTDFKKGLQCYTRSLQICILNACLFLLVSKKIFFKKCFQMVYDELKRKFRKRKKKELLEHFFSKSKFYKLVKCKKACTTITNRSCLYSNFKPLFIYIFFRFQTDKN